MSFSWGRCYNVKCQVSNVKCRMLNVKAAIEREKSQTRLNFSEREQARDKVSNVVYCAMFFSSSIFWKSLRRRTKLLVRYLALTMGLAASSGGVPWNRICPSKSM